MKNSLVRFENPDYKDYKYGTPQQGANDLLLTIEDLKIAAQTAKLECGDALWPGMKDALKNDVMDMLNKLN